MNKILRRANSKVSLGGAATLLIVVALVGQVLGFLRNRLIATNFTTLDPGSSDAFFAAFVIPDFFYFTIAAGALGVAYMPVLADKIAQGQKKAVQDITNSLINVSIIAMLIVALIIFVFAKPLMNLLAPNLPPENFQQAVTIMQLLALNPLFFALGGIVTSLQQTYGRFFFYAVSSLFYNMAIIASIFIFKDSLGVVGLGVGALVGGVLQLIVSLMGLYGLGYKYRPVIKWKSEDFRFVLRQLPPRSLDQGIDQVNSVVEVNRAQALGTGPVSYYTFATTLHNVPIMLLGNSIATAAFPRLIDRLSQGRPDLFRKDFIKILLTMLWLVAPVSIVAWFARGYLARLIFGDFSGEIALIFGYLTVAIICRIIYSMFSRYFYAHKDTLTPLYVSIFAIALNIYLAFRLVHPDTYGVAGLALAQSIVAFSEVAILMIIMIIRDRKLFSPYFWTSIIKLVSVTGFSVVAAFIAVSFLPLTVSDRGIVALGSKLLVISGVTFATHLLVSYIFGLDQAKFVVKKSLQIILKPVRIQV
jgi:putative peptidoglycan lipid II flippase